jgi:hypothetical protein
MSSPRNVDIPTAATATTNGNNDDDSEAEYDRQQLQYKIDYEARFGRPTKYNSEYNGQSDSSVEAHGQSDSSVEAPQKDDLQWVLDEMRVRKKARQEQLDATDHIHTNPKPHLTAFRSTTSMIYPPPDYETYYTLWTDFKSIEYRNIALEIENACLKDRNIALQHVLQQVQSAIGHLETMPNPPDPNFTSTFDPQLLSKPHK